MMQYTNNQTDNVTLDNGETFLIDLADDIADTIDHALLVRQDDIYRVNVAVRRDFTTSIPEYYHYKDHDDEGLRYVAERAEAINPVIADWYGYGSDTVIYNQLADIYTFSFELGTARIAPEEALQDVANYTKVFDFATDDTLTETIRDAFIAYDARIQNIILWSQLTAEEQLIVSYFASHVSQDFMENIQADVTADGYTNSDDTPVTVWWAEGVRGMFEQLIQRFAIRLRDDLVALPEHTRRSTAARMADILADHASYDPNGILYRDEAYDLDTEVRLWRIEHAMIHRSVNLSLASGMMELSDDGYGRGGKLQFHPDAIAAIATMYL